jgi:hypothetical protein
MRYVAVVLRDDLSRGLDWEVRYWGTEGTVPLPDQPFARVAAITPQSTVGPAAYGEVSRTYAVHLYPKPQNDPEQAVMEAERVEEQMHLAFEIGWEYDDNPVAAPEGIVMGGGSGGGALAAGTYDYYVTAVVDGSESNPGHGRAVVVNPNNTVTMHWGITRDAAPLYRVYRRLGTAVFLIAEVAGSTAVNGLMTLNDAGLAGSAAVVPPSLTVTSNKKRIPLYDYDGVPLDGLGSVSYARGSHDYLRVQSCTIDRGEDPEDDRYFRVIVQVRVTWRRRGHVPTDRGQIVQEVRLRENVS